MKLGKLWLLVLLLGGVTGCSGTGGTPEPAPVTSALSAAFDQVPVSALGASGEFEFGDLARLRTLNGDQAWRFEAYRGMGSLASSARILKETIGIDPDTATTALSVGSPPAAMLLLTGGQDQQAITAAAIAAGWTGTGTLSHNLDLSGTNSTTALLVISASKIRPTGTDVVTGGQGSDPASININSDQPPVVLAARNCLGDVVVAGGSGLTAAGPVTAAGVRVTSSGAPTSVICLGSADQAAAKALAAKVTTELASGRTKATRQAWTELLPDPTVETLPGVPALVRITAAASSSKPTLVLSLLAQRDLP